MTCCTHDCNEGRECSCGDLHQQDGGAKVTTDFATLLPADPPLAPADRDAQQARIAVIAVLALAAACAVAIVCGWPVSIIF